MGAGVRLLCRCECLGDAAAAASVPVVLRLLVLLFLLDELRRVPVILLPLE